MDDINNATLTDLGTILNTAKKGLPNIQNQVRSTQNLNNSVEEALQSLNESYNPFAPAIKQDIDFVGNMMGQVSDLSKTLDSGSKLVGDDVLSILSRMDSKTKKSIGVMESTIRTLKK